MDTASSIKPPILSHVFRFLIKNIPEEYAEILSLQIISVALKKQEKDSKVYADFEIDNKGLVLEAINSILNSDLNIEIRYLDNDLNPARIFYIHNAKIKCVTSESSYSNYESLQIKVEMNCQHIIL